MESNNQANETKLCSNCHTFFGTHATNFMCSKCFREVQKEQQSAQAMTTTSEPVQNQPKIIAASESLPNDSVQ
jgi:ribosomal protein S27AE